MSSSDKRISVALAVFISISSILFVSELATSSPTSKIGFLNLAVSLSLILYWAQKQIRITHHFIELREVVVLCFEAAVVGCSIYSIFIEEQISWLRMVHFIVAGIHLLALLAFFVLMLTLKIKKLF